MKKETLFSLDTPYREPFVIEAFTFGPDADTATTSAQDGQQKVESVAIIGSLRGNEVQQTFICASVVQQLQQLEQAGALPPNVRIMVVPSANSFSMNISSRFWPMDNTDINRMFPGYNLGETTQRIADGLFSAIKDCTYGIQLCSFYLPGDFDPHVRVTDTGAIDRERSESLARRFGFPYLVHRKPSPFDTTTLNYNWQVWGTYAFSLYSAATDTLDWDSARFTVSCIMRFLSSLGRHGEELQDVPQTQVFDEGSLVEVKTTRGGFLDRAALIGQKVHRGQVLASVLSPEDCSVREQLVSPCDGTVFFRHRSVLVNGHTIAFTVISD